MQSISTGSTLLNYSETYTTNVEAYNEVFKLDISQTEKVKLYLDINSYKCVKQIAPVCYTNEPGVSLCLVCAQISDESFLSEVHFYHYIFQANVGTYIVCSDCSIPLFIRTPASSCDQCTAISEDFFADNPLDLNSNICHLAKKISGETLPFRYIRRTNPFDRSFQLEIEE